MKKSEIIILSIVVLFFIVAAYFYFYFQLPENLASHWNIKGEVDDYMPKFWGLFLMPVISLGIALLFIIVPRIDPLKANIEKFRKYFDAFIVLLMMFLAYLYLLVILWNLGYEFNMSQFMAPVFAGLVYYCGVLARNAKRNWSIGFRTPWTLSSERVWNKTNRLGGNLFKISGVIALAGIFFPAYLIYLLIAPVSVSAIYTVIYSYFEYRKEKDN